MLIALTKKLASAMGVKPVAAQDDIDPLFSWAANWTNTFDGRKEDMVVLVNSATRFTVLIYGVKWNQFKGIAAKMTAAIRNTLLAMNIDPEVVDEYLSLAGEVAFTSNHDRRHTAWLNHQGLDAALVVGCMINESIEEVKYEDTAGRLVSRLFVNVSKRFDDAFVPAEEMVKALEALTGRPAYRYRAFELLVTLDLGVYQARRRLIVPADIEFTKLHSLLQQVFRWNDCHLHEFTVLDGKSQNPAARLVMAEEALFHDSDAMLETECRLSEYFPKHSRMIYTYDMGDSWEHVIDLVRVIEECSDETPYLLEASGQTPPEDVGGVPGFIGFREIMLDPNHPDHAETKKWAGYWSPELREWDAKPKVVHC